MESNATLYSGDPSSFAPATGLGASSAIPAGDVTSSATSPWSIRTIILYGGIVLILALLGLNLFASLGNATDRLSSFLRPGLATAGGAAAATVKQTVDVAAKGASGIANTAARGVDGALDALDEGLSRSARARHRSPPRPDDAGSSTQRSRVSLKSGYCYIGEDRGYRSCLKVQSDDECVSGQVYSSKEQCVHPGLR